MLKHLHQKPKIQLNFCLVLAAAKLQLLLKLVNFSFYLLFIIFVDVHTVEIQAVV